MFAAQYVFMKQPGRNSMLGIDLQYDDMNGCLGLLLRYCKEKASDNLALSTIIQERMNTSRAGPDVVTQQQYSEGNHNFSSTIKKDAVFNYGSLTYKVLDSYNHNKSAGNCVVTSSLDTSVPVNTVHELSYELIHRQICLFIQSLFS